MQTPPVVVEATYNTSIQNTWSALTDNNQMKKWYFHLDEFVPQKGFQFQFEGGTESRTYTHLCEITEVIPSKKISYSWKYKGYPGISFVTFELSPEGDKTRLRVTHAGLETFPSSPDFAKENFRNGWDSIIGTNLKKFLEKNS
jgi:uncharacterized protein YndB with AHSA1/START domain